jgi:hypothetical protein
VGGKIDEDHRAQEHQKWFLYYCKRIAKDLQSEYCINASFLVVIYTRLTDQGRILEPFTSNLMKYRPSKAEPDRF